MAAAGTRVYLVVGATGPVGLGGEICRLLRAGGKATRALVRATAAPERVAGLRDVGVELVPGDLRDSRSLEAACRGVHAVISTASIMVSRQPSDTVENVDAGGQATLVDAAGAAGVESVQYVSFSGHIDRAFPFRDAKRAVERHLKQSGLAYTILRPTFLMEVWLSPVAGFDFQNARATIYGRGDHRISWMSFHDVARFAVTFLDHPAARDRTFELGGPEALSPHEVVRIFEEIGGRRFALEHVSEEQLEEQEATAPDSLQRSFAGLQRCYAAGDVVDMRDTLASFPVALTSVRDYARQVLSARMNGS